MLQNVTPHNKYVPASRVWEGGVGGLRRVGVRCWVRRECGTDSGALLLRGATVGCRVSRRRGVSGGLGTVLAAPHPTNGGSTGSQFTHYFFAVVRSWLGWAERGGGGMCTGGGLWAAGPGGLVSKRLFVKLSGVGVRGHILCFTGLPW